MFSDAVDAITSKLLSLKDGANLYPSDATASLTIEGMPECYTLKQLYTSLVLPTLNCKQNTIARLAILEQALREPAKILREEADAGTAQALASWTSKVIFPILDWGDADGTSEDDLERAKRAACEYYRFISVLGMLVIERLDVLTVDLTARKDPAILLSLLSFTDSDDLWTCSDAKALALELLSRNDSQFRSQGFIKEYLLGDYLQPLFSKSKPNGITSNGRRSVNPNSRPAYDASQFDPSSKPWKFQNLSAVTVFSWVVTNIEEELIRTSWHLFIPPLLTLLDDLQTDVRRRGLLVLAEFLKKVSSKVLKQTGLGEVFEDAVIPTLLFLPTLTPVEESMRLLRPAYSALFLLADVRFPEHEDQFEKMKLLDRIMRQGIFQGYHHSADSVPIVKLLLEQTGILICRMKMYAVKHLKDVVPILSATLCDPFSTADPSLLLAAIELGQQTILSCWPRISEAVYLNELIKALTLCWTSIADDELKGDSRLESVKHELLATSTLLLRSVESRVDIERILSPLLENNLSLGELFPIYHKTRA